MSTVVMKMGEGNTLQLEKQLTASAVASPNPYVRFAAKYLGVTILVYTSGKIVFQGSKAEEVAATFGYVTKSKHLDTNTTQVLPMIGTDEVGNGSYFGGVAVVASFVTPKEHPLLQQLGVGDSKTLTDDKIRQIAPILQTTIPHKALLLTPKKYNEVVGKDKTHNAVSVKVALHNQAIFLLLQSGVLAKKIVIDAFTSTANYNKYLKNEYNQFTNPVTLVEKAEGQYLAVAVSSIIARYLFLENLKELSQVIGYPLPSGAGKKSDEVASQILTTKGLAGLEQTAKLHFANTQKALTLLKKKGTQ